MNTRITLSLLLLLMGFNMALAQKTLTGKVIGDDGNPILGATVSIKGTTIGTISGEDGSYRLNVPENVKADTIVFSYIGMETLSQAVGGRTSIDAKLLPSDVSVEEVVVTALGISRSEKSLGYAATKINSAEILESKNANVMQALSGKVSGVEIMGNSGPGSSQNVMIRGAASLSNNQPLYIVDGVPLINKQSVSGDNLNYNTDMGTGLNAVNPNDIETMTVLKGAAATALYGSRAANGVIMITTKSGKNSNGKMSINYDGTFAIERVGYLSKAQEMFGQGWDNTFSREENGNWGPAFTDQLQPWGYVVDNQQQVAKFSFLEDRLKDFYELGFNNSHALSLSGGNATTSYYFSLSNTHEDGVIPMDYDTYNRTTLSMRGSHKWNKVTIASSINVANEKTLAVPSGQGASIIRGIWDSPANISLVDLKDLDNKFNQNSNYFTPFGYNPYYVIENFSAELHRLKIYGKVQADVQICKNLKLTDRFGGDFEPSTTEARRNSITFEPGSPQDVYGGIVFDGYYDNYKRNEYEINNDLYLHFNKSISDKMNISVIAGYSVQEEGYNDLYSSINNLVLPDFFNLKNSTSDPITTQYNYKVRRLGAYANVDFDYDNMLFLTITGRNDWSSTLPTSNNSFFYPGITLSWIFTELGDNSKLGPLTFGKFRASYGMTGKDAPAYYVYDYFIKSQIYNYGYNNIGNLTFPLSGTTSWAVSDVMGNPSLNPELTTEFEFGAELVFLDGRFGIDGDYYNKYTKDLIDYIDLDFSTGYRFTYANIGDIRNQGVELNAFVYPVKNNNFSWKLAVNYSKNNNKVEKLASDEIYLKGFSTAGIYAVEGKSIGQFKTSTAKSVVNPNDGITYTVVDAKGNPQASTDMVYVDKDVNEKYRLGLTSRWEYKGFSLEGTLDFHYGGYMFCYTKDYLGWTGSGYETTQNDRNPFVIPNSVVECNANTPNSFVVDDVTYIENTTPVSSYNSGLPYFYAEGGFDYNNDLIIDRSYLKLRNVTLSYSLPSNICHKIKLSKVSFSLSASNILLWTPKENCYIDPECTTFDSGIGAKFGELGANPTNQVYTFGVSLGF